MPWCCSIQNEKEPSGMAIPAIFTRDQEGGKEGSVIRLGKRMTRVACFGKETTFLLPRRVCVYGLQVFKVSDHEVSYKSSTPLVESALIPAML